MASSQSSTMAEVTRNRIEGLVNEHAHSTTKPPFSEQQLFMMAMLMMQDEPHSITDICAWIVDNLRYYRDMARAHLSYYYCDACTTWLSSTSTYSPDLPAHEFNTKLLETVWHFETDMLTRVIGKHDRLHSLTLAERSWLPFGPWIPPGQGVFPFFRLPREIRAAIYEMVFRYPKSGVLPAQRLENGLRHFNSDRSLLLTVVTRCYEEEFSLSKWDAIEEDTARSFVHEHTARSFLHLPGRIQTSPHKDILAPLLVN